MSQMRVNVSARLPADHPFQPPMIEPLNFIPADAEVVGEPTVPESANLNESSSHPKPTTQTSKSSILDELVNHCSGELPGYETNQEKASEVASDEVTLESPQQQEPNLQMASTTCPNIPIPEQIGSEQHVPEQTVPEQLVPELDFMIRSDVSDVEIEQGNSFSTVVLTHPSETNTQTAQSNMSSNIFTNDQPSFSNQAIQACAPAKSTNVPSPPTLFLDSSILADVCENIFQELNKLVQARNNLVPEDNYVK
jgi:hypothetical protein